MDIKQKLITKNYTKGRTFNDGGKILRIVLHTYGGTGTSLYNWFMKNTVGVSSHYAVLKDGTVEQYVRDEDTAHANGHGWYNAHALSIEFQDDNNPNDSVRTAEQYEAGGWLIFMLCLKYGIPTSFEGIRTHKQVLNEIGKDKVCPGGLDVNRLISYANHHMQEYNNAINRANQAEAEKAALVQQLDEYKSASEAEKALIQAKLEKALSEIEELKRKATPIKITSDSVTTSIEEVDINPLRGFLQTLIYLFKKK